jgi:Zn-dependent alcohol dehydrogenase
VRLYASGVCHSDLNAIDGTATTPCPAVLGHEGAGIVEAVGPGVRSVRPGQHVALSWAPSCGACEECLRDLHHLCSEAWPAMGTGGLMDSTTRLSRDGEPVYHYSFLSTFADRTVVPEASCVRIRRDAPLRVAALVGCAIATGVGAVVNRARLAPGSSLAVFGAGGVGLSAVQAGVLSGARTVVAVDPAPARRALALDLGAAHEVDPGDGDPAEAVRELTGGRGADYAVESSGAPGAATAAFRSIRRGGTLVCVGLPPAGASVAFPGPELVRDEKTVMGCLYGSCRPHTDMPMLIDLHMAGRLQLDRLMGAVYPLDEIDRAFADMLDGTGARTLIDLS